MTQRFKPIPLDQMNEQQRAAAQNLIDGPRKGLRGPFNALLRNPTLTDRVRLLGDSIRFESTLEPLHREFAILITAKFWSADYEWYAHSQLALEYGLDPAVVDAIRVGEAPLLSDPDLSLIYEFTHEILFDKDVGDVTYEKAIQRFGELSTLDLLSTIGYFGFVSVILNAIRQPIPEGAVPLPRKGLEK
jgi:4-carboxymuconolactone decarboxylase